LETTGKNAGSIKLFENTKKKNAAPDHGAAFFFALLWSEEFVDT
jgi:hypothetical protein